jgi:hypothetical protein
MPVNYAQKKATSHFIQFFLGGLGIMLMIVGGFLALNAANSSQDIRQQAAGNTPQVIFSLQSSQVSSNKMRVDVMVNTQANDLAAVDLRGALSGAPKDRVFLDQANSLFMDTVKEEVTGNSTQLNFRVVKFASIDKQKPANTHGQTQPLFTFYITQPENDRVSITLSGPTSSVSIIGSSNVDISYPGTQTFTLNPNQDKKTCNQNCATDTECQSDLFCYKGQCRARSNSEDTYCGHPPDLGLQRTCDQYCADGKECGTGLSCYYNKCRNPKNLANTKCANPTPRPVATAKPIVKVVTPVPTPTTGFVVTLVSPTPIYEESTPYPTSNIVIPTVTPEPTISASPSATPAETESRDFQSTSQLGTLLLMVGVLSLIGGIAYLFLKKSSS